MKPRLLMVLAVSALTGAGAVWADEQVDAKALLGKAIKAMGGPDKLAKLGTVAGKARLTASRNGQEMVVDIDGIWQGLSQYRADMDIHDGNQILKGTLVLNGVKGWFKKMDKTEDMPEGLAPFIQNFFYAARMPQLLPALTEPGYTLAPLGEVKIGDKTAVGVTVSHKDFKDVSLFFDKESGFPIKSEIRLMEPRRDNETTIECHYGDYKDFDGVKLCGTITVKMSNENHEFKLELSELKAANKLPDDRFDMP
jgi:hypothetical protein